MSQAPRNSLVTSFAFSYVSRWEHTFTLQLKCNIPYSFPLICELKYVLFLYFVVVMFSESRSCFPQIVEGVEWIFKKQAFALSYFYCICYLVLSELLSSDFSVCSVHLLCVFTIYSFSLFFPLIFDLYILKLFLFIYPKDGVDKFLDLWDRLSMQNAHKSLKLCSQDYLGMEKGICNLSNKQIVQRNSLTHYFLIWNNYMNNNFLSWSHLAKVQPRVKRCHVGLAVCLVILNHKSDSQNCGIAGIWRDL